MKLQFTAALRLRYGLLPASFVFWPLLQICNFAFIKMFVHNSTICFLVVLLVDFPKDYC